MDEGHAALVGAVAARLSSLGWEVRPEVSFAVYAERGSIDLVAWHAASRTLLVIEVKTEIVSLEETLRRHDAKVRLASGVVAERFGWRPLRVSRLLVLPDATTPRRQVARHDDVLRAGYPLRGPALRAWLREPSGSVAGLAYLPPTKPGRAPDRATRRRPVARPEVQSARADASLFGGRGSDPSATDDPGSSSARPPSAPPADHEEGSYAAAWESTAARRHDAPS